MSCELEPETLIEALYGEASAATQERVRQHLGTCAACRDEWQALGGLRRQLGAWKLPATPAPPRLGFATRAQLWRLAAAAGLLLAFFAGLGLSGARLGYGPGGLTLSFGGREGELQRLLQEQEQRHVQALAALEARLARPAPAPAATAPGPESASLTPVRLLIEESERRQARRFELALADQRERLEVQRRYDLARISAGLSYLDGKNGQNMARTSELMGYLLQASDQR